MKNVLEMYQEDFLQRKIEKHLYTKNAIRDLLVLGILLLFGIVSLANNNSCGDIYSFFQDEEYALHPVGNALLGENPVQRFSFELTGKGYVIHPKNTSQNAITLDVIGIYSANASLNNQSIALETPHPNQAVYWQNNFKIEYINNALGLRQNFIINQNQNTNQLHVLLMICGATPVLKNSKTISLQNANGQEILSYADLNVWDANGEKLDAAFTTSGQQVYINLKNIQSAAYPITIDPISTTPDWQAEINQAGAYFGRSLSSAGDVNGDGFNDVIIGSLNFSNGQSNEGAAFVYHGSGVGLCASPNWQFESNYANAKFGYYVKKAGDVNGDGFDDVMVSAADYTKGQNREGAVYVFYGSSTGLDTAVSWFAEGNVPDSRFGDQISAAGDVNNDGYDDIVIGAVERGVYTGAAYMYLGSSTGLGNTPAWQFNGTQQGAAFGTGISGGGDINGDGFDDIVVGAFWYTNGQANIGQAYVFYGSATGLSSSANLTLQGNTTNIGFGHQSAFAGDVNSDGYDDLLISSNIVSGQNGRVQLYLGGSSGLNTTASWVLVGTQINEAMGYRLAGLGDANKDGFDDIIVGAYQYTNGESEEGRALVFYGNSFGLDTVAAREYESNQAEANFGLDVAGAGDVNGDGWDDILVGASRYDNGQADEGAAFLFYGNSSNFNVHENNNVEASIYFSNHQLQINSAALAGVIANLRITDMAGHTMYDSAITLSAEEQFVAFRFNPGVYVVQLYNVEKNLNQVIKLICVE